LESTGAQGCNTGQNGHQVSSLADSAAANAGINAGAGGNTKKRNNVDNSNQ